VSAGFAHISTRGHERGSGEAMGAAHAWVRRISCPDGGLSRAACPIIQSEGGGERRNEVRQTGDVVSGKNNARQLRATLRKQDRHGIWRTLTQQEN